MVERLRNVFGRADLRLLSFVALAVLAATLIFSMAQEKGDPLFSQEEYDEIFSHQLNDIYDLEQWFAEQQSAFLPILPPPADFVLSNQPGNPGLLPFHGEKFPKDFTTGLVGIKEYSVSVYPITIVEDAKTRALKFYNFDGKEFFTLDAATEYDPFAYLKESKPGLYTVNANPANRSYWQGIFDPARVQITVSLIAPDDVAHWLYAKAKVEAAQESEEEGGGEMLRVMLENSTTNIYFTQVKNVTNGVSMTIAYPSGFTNGLDVFTCNELAPEIWSFATLALPTTGTNLTWVDTNAWISTGIPVRMYAASDATTDADGDGYPDGREIMVYDTDPNAATSRPVQVSGTISYSGAETGTIYVLFNLESNSWSLAKSLSMSAPGSYTNIHIGNYQSYWFSAFRDVNGNFTRDPWEPWGIYSQNSTLITGDTSGINITLQDVPSVWGQVSYTGSATGDVYVVAVSSSNSWDMTHQTVISWVQSVGETGDQHYVTFPASYVIAGFPASNYWVRAFMDEDANAAFTPGEPVGEYATTAIPVSNRLTGINITLNLDSDGDGLSDFEELYQTGTSPTNTQDGIALLVQTRAEVARHWNMIYTQPLVLTNGIGSAQDLADLRTAIQTIATNFFRPASPSP